jgi:hypothetical protein
MPLKSIAHAYDAADLSVLEQAYSWACREIDIDRARRAGDERHRARAGRVAFMLHEANEKLKRQREREQQEQQYLNA